MQKKLIKLIGISVIIFSILTYLVNTFLIHPTNLNWMLYPLIFANVSILSLNISKIVKYQNRTALNLIFLSISLIALTFSILPMLNSSINSLTLFQTQITVLTLLNVPSVIHFLIK